MANYGENQRGLKNSLKNNLTLLFLKTILKETTIVLGDNDEYIKMNAFCWSNAKTILNRLQKES